ncbi:hypothetical protein ADINL_2784 [Nitrincola lacisaponensis]|uniref:Transferrin-binding protein B C-lobe/N-lobe beta barrel domain-containing protein n=1 Tax=Nitrincola lacisaponensis TaxID=267850 RepID=A0A063Y0S0_9GAMM|nr:Slam-dependent surface lipoprotein [Nitrincola lacisaponensis]KDE38770.1 hypothetical protein ADINL_2784 [Nitrincola lacisaponensis]
MKKQVIASSLLVAMAAFSLVGQAQAAVVGGSSNTNQIVAGESQVNGGPHTAGLAGIAAASININLAVDFVGLTGYSSFANDVYSLGGGGHGGMGAFNFAQVGSDDVWFGEWSESTDNSTRTVYYSGADADTSVPSSGSATYNVVGINNYDGNVNSLLNGTLTANFGTSTLTGSISNSNGLTIDLGTANINTDASISGANATAVEFGVTMETNGAVSGQFYNGHSSLAGLVDFAGTQYDTAFGGSQD